MKEITREVFIEYLKSSVITFFSFFIISLASQVGPLQGHSIEAAGWVGVFTTIVRFFGKALFEGFVGSIIMLAAKLKEAMGR